MSTLIPPLRATERPLPTKVVVRLLPPLISDEDICKCIPENLAGEIDWREFCQGVRPERPSPENPVLNSRMYLSFKKFRIACDFMTAMHGKVFIDDKGETFRAVAAFAPFQRVPRRWKQLKNLHQGKIESEKHYQEFIEKVGRGPEKPKPTPVLFINERKEGYVSPLVALIAKQNAIIDEQIEERWSKVNPTMNSAPQSNPGDRPQPIKKKQKDFRPPAIIPVEGGRPPLAVCSFESTEPKAAGAPKRGPARKPPGKSTGAPQMLKRS